MSNSISIFGIEIRPAALITFLVLLMTLFIPRPGYNELDALAYSHALYNPDWIRGDWYLSRSIAYRYFFSYFSGFLVAKMGLFATIALGRIASYILFAYAFGKLLSCLRIRLFWSTLALLVFLLYFEQTNGAHEWMIGGFETKVFSYGFALLALVSAMRKAWSYSAFYLGVALSFHLLVGLYSAFAISLCLVLNFDSLKGHLVRLAVLYVIGGAIGLYGVAQHFLSASAELDTIYGVTGWDIYAWLRVPHHVMPPWTNAQYLWFLLFGVIHGLAWRFGKGSLRYLTAFGTMCFALLFLGWGIQFFGHGTWLKYYFFRLPDTWLPLSSLLIVAQFLSVRTKLGWASRLWPTMGLLILVGVAGRFSMINELGSFKMDRVKESISMDPEMERFVREETPREAVLMVPVDLKSHYWVFERPVWVTFKNSPQDADDLVEWYRRLSIQNGHSKPSTSGYALKDEVNRAYERIEEKDLVQLKQEGIDFVLLPDSADWRAPSMKRTAQFVLIDLSQY